MKGAVKRIFPSGSIFKFACAFGMFFVVFVLLLCVVDTVISKCPDGYFGTSCSLQCHCPPGNTCLPTNGLCNSGICAAGWDGPGCQTKVPVLTEKPWLTLTVPSTVEIQFKAWSSDNPDDKHLADLVSSYAIEYQYASENKVAWSDWKLATKIPSLDGTSVYAHNYTSAKPHHNYRFRVSLIPLVNGKPSAASIPGPASDEIFIPDAEIQTTPAEISTPLSPVTSKHVARDWVVDTDRLCSAQVYHVTEVDGSEHVRVTWSSVLLPHTLLVALMPAKLPNETRTVDKLALSISPASSHGNDEELMLNSSKVLQVARVVLPSVTVSNVTSDVNSKRSLVVRLPLTVVKHRVKTLMPLNVHMVLVEASVASNDIFLHKKLGVAILERSRDQLATETMVLRRHHPHLHHSPASDDHEQHRNQGQGKSHDLTAGSPWTVANISQRFQDSISGRWLVLESTEPGDFLSGRILPSLAVDKHRTRAERHIRHAFNVGLQENTVSFRLPANSLSNATTFRAIVVYELVIDNQTLLLGFSVCNDSIILPAALVSGNDGAVIDIWTVLLAVGTFLILLIVICVFLFLHLRKRRHKRLEIEAQTRAKSSVEQCKSVAGDQANTRLLRSSKLNMMQLSERRKNCSAPAEETTFCSRSSLPIGSLGNSINRRVLGGPFLDVGDMPEFWNIPKVERRLMDEFASLPTGFVYSTAVANLPQNEPFNRSHFVVPYDRNRVDVPMVACTFPLRSSSYINASVVSSARGNIFYVTQTPMSVCQEQFWLMVWNYNISSVVMLTDLNDSRARLARFWPLRKQGTVQYGSVAITINSERSTAHWKFYALKLVSLKCEREKRLVYLWQFVSWLEYGVPNSTFAFLEFVRDIRRGESRESAVCVVCPTGGGRSGLYVALDSLLDEGHETESVNVFRTVARLRRERPNLVRTKAQYLFLYQAVIDHFSYVGKEVSPSAVFSGRDIKTEFRQLIDSFKTPPPVYDPDQSTLRSNVPLHSTSQSPASEILHEAVCEPSPVMTSTPLTKKDLSKKQQQQQAAHGHVILADCTMIRRVDTFHHRDAMLLLPSSISVDSEAFWQTLYEEKAAMLINVDHGGAAIGSDDIQHWPRLTVKRGSTHCLESFSYRDVKLSQAPRSSSNKKLRHYVFRCWPRDEEGDRVDTLPPPAQLVTFLRVVVHWYSRCCEDGRAPVAVYSAHTQNRAVLFSVLWNVVERLQTQHHEHAGHALSIDLFNLVRHTYTNIIPHLTQEEYSYLYTVLHQLEVTAAEHHALTALDLAVDDHDLRSADADNDSSPSRRSSSPSN